MHNVQAHVHENTVAWQQVKDACIQFKPSLPPPDPTHACTRFILAIAT